jgi:solute carrier family 38 (sodium-coupled neutral amino acid transporter), member 11
LPEFELDSDELDDETTLHLETHEYPIMNRQQTSTPLLVGLVDSAHARRSLDGAMRLNGTQPHSYDEDYDLEQLAKKRLAGGGMLDSIANMANSILGAGATLILTKRVFSQLT